ncbi:GtrA family protein [Neptuniibacter sp.]|uniref:GtrA family protein n=1 Tax=Neptuniibacter sp. TaxID=1962643 RepID=UPI003B592576
MMTLSKKTLWQLFSYLFIGLVTNISGYFLYFLITYFLGHPKLTMTFVYSLGALLGFLANRRFTFRHDGHIGTAGIRYLVVQLSGYLLNLLLLIVFVDYLGIAHQLVQAVAIVVVAIFLFVSLRCFVFKSNVSGCGEEGL